MDNLSWLYGLPEHKKLTIQANFSLGSDVMMIISDSQLAFVTTKNAWEHMLNQSVCGNTDDEIYNNMFCHLIVNMPEWINRAEELGYRYNWGI